MSKKTFITKDDLLFYHNETAEQLKTALQKIKSNIGNINFSEKFSEIDNRIQNTTIKGLEYDQENNTTTFKDNGEPGDIVLNDVYVLRNHQFVPLSDIIGGINSYNKNVNLTYINGDLIVDDIDANSVDAGKILVSDVDDSGIKYDVLEELMKKTDVFTFEDTLDTIYIVLNENGDILNSDFYISKNHQIIGSAIDFILETLKYVEFENRQLGGKQKTLTRVAFVNVLVFKHTVNMEEDFDSEYNQEQLLVSEPCIFYYKSKYLYVKRSPVQIIHRYHFDSIISGKYVFHVFFNAENDELLISLIENKTPIDEIVDNELRPVTSNAVYDAIENVNSNIANTYATKSTCNTIQSNVTNIRDLLYNVTSRVDDLDLSNITFDQILLIDGTLKKSNNSVSKLTSTERQYFIEKYGSENLNHIVLLPNDPNHRYAQNFVIGDNLIFNKFSSTKYTGCTILDIELYKTTLTISYYAIYVSKDIWTGLNANDIVNLSMLKESMPEAPVVTISNVTQTTAQISWTDVDENVRTHIIVKKNNTTTVLDELYTYSSNIHSVIIPDLYYGTTYTIYSTSKIGSYESSAKIANFTTDNIVEPDHVYVYLPNVTTTAMIKARDNGSYDDHELFNNGIIYTSEKFNAKTSDFYNGTNLNTTLYNDGNNSSPANWLVSSGEQLTVLIQPDPKKAEYLFNLSIEADGNQIFDGALKSTDELNTPSGILWDNSIITETTVNVRGQIGRDISFFDGYGNTVTAQILKVNWLYPNDPNELPDYFDHLNIYETSNLGPQELPNTSLFQLQPFVSVFYAIIIKNCNNVNFRFIINKPNTVQYFVKSFVYDFNVYSINRLIKNLPIITDKNKLGLDTDNAVSAYCENVLHNIMIQYDDFNSNQERHIKICPIAPVFYNNPDYLKNKKIHIDVHNDKCLVKGKYFNQFYDGNQSYEYDSFQYLTIYFTYGLNDLYAEFDPANAWTEDLPHAKAMLADWNDDLVNNKNIQAAYATYNFYPEIVITIYNSLDLDDIILTDMINYIDYANGHLLPSSLPYKLQQLHFGNNNDLAIRVSNIPSSDPRNPDSFIVRPGMFALTVDIKALSKISQDDAGIISGEPVKIKIDVTFNYPNGKQTQEIILENINELMI